MGSIPIARAIYAISPVEKAGRYERSDEGSIPSSRANTEFVVQLAERRSVEPKVESSSLSLLPITYARSRQAALTPVLKTVGSESYGDRHLGLAPSPNGQLNLEVAPLDRDTAGGIRSLAGDWRGQDDPESR